MVADLNMEWKVNTPGLLREVLMNNGAEILRVPISIFGDILSKVGERAAELNDPQLNALMCRLAIYSVADPESPDYEGPGGFSPGPLDAVVGRQGDER